ncbi:MAG TPA: TonB-dependent receptor [Lysobacter sp.]|nr:TonB-dependent receptor [Lysobacter sp.]
MPAIHHNRLALAVVAALAVGTALPVLAQETDTGTQATTLDALTVTGTRVKGRTAEETAAPVDVISREELNATGAMEIGQILQVLEPSFNFSRTTISDGTDIIRPATLRALGSDQVLVLVNGKRRHQQALVNVQQTIARGSAGTDINAIPISAVERIEVLRDGAAAQYGSDAIAGVINIILRKNTDETTVHFEVGETYEGDGQVLHGGVNTGFKLGEEGYLNLTAEYRDREETNRAGPDSLRVDPPRVTQRIGDADAKDAYLWFNGMLPVGPGELYAFGGVSKREGDSSGFFRSAGDGRTVPDLYPNGFLPNIITTVEDGSMFAGYRMPIGDAWDMDVSLGHGRNKFGFEERNSVNVSWWYEPLDGADAANGIYGESPTSADTGTLIFDQTTFNLDFRGTLDWGVGDEPLYLATGAEYRRENYEIQAGDLWSYAYGRTNDPTIPIFDQNGGSAAPGIQGFPGFSPQEAVDDGRHSYGLYVDAETKLAPNFTVGAALRFEDYSDFGNTTTGKLSARWDATEAFALRGTVSTGFRAPGVQQLFYSQRSTNIDANTGLLADTLTARQDSDVTRAFGIEALKEEESVSATLGVVWKPTTNFSVTMDVFQIDIDDRIIFSSNIVPEPAAGCLPDNSNCPIRAILAPFNVAQAQFFTNAIDTRTRGVDVVAQYSNEALGGTLDLTTLLHFNSTEVTARRSQSAILPPEVLFDDSQVTLIEEGQPRQHHVFQAVLHRGKFDWLARANYYGSVAGEGFTPGIKQKWDGATLFDAAITFRATEKLSFTVGGNNLFDTYPDKWDEVGGFPFPQLGFTYGWETLPFGINGGYYYAKVDFRF